MKIIVLGGQGFIGHNLVLRLLKEEHDVSIFCKKINYDRYLKGVKYIEGDFNCIFKYKHIFKDTDVVYHLISSTIPSTSNIDMISDVKSNVVSSINLIEMCCECNVKKIVFASSGGAVYGINKNPIIDEDCEANPISSYGIGKLMIEKYLHLFNYLRGINYTILRVSNPYGPFQNTEKNQGVISIFLKKCIKDELIEIYGDGLICRDYVYITDVIHAFYLCKDCNTVNGIINIGSGKGYTLNELIHIIGRVTNKKLYIEMKSSRKFDVPTNVLNIEKAKNELGWEPSIGIEEGIELTNKWIKL